MSSLTRRRAARPSARVVRARPAIAALAVAVLVVLAVGRPAVLAAQNPDMALTPAERDSALAHYDQIFPFGGRQAVARGFDLPLPLGFNVGYFWMQQDLVISNLGLGFNKEPEPVDFIEFETASAKLSNLNARIDLWLLPVLNLYVMGGYGFGETTVKLAKPIPFETTAEFTGGNVGIGATGAFGFKRTFVVVDYNHQWAFSSLLEAPVPADIFSARLGRSFRVGERSKGVRGTAWIGTMLQSMKARTEGNINLADVADDGTAGRFADYEQSAWYQALQPRQQAVVDDMVQRLQGGLDTTTVSYRLDKKPADPWNMLVGGTFDFGQHWGVRYEVGFIGRTSVMLMGNYRVRL